MAERPRAPEQPTTGSKRRRVVWLAAACVVAAGLVVSSRFIGRSRGPVSDARPARSDAVRIVDEPGAAQDPSSPQLRLEGAFDRVLPLRPGDVVHLEASQLPAAGDVELELDLGEASADAGARPVRIYRDGRVRLELETRPLEGDLTLARLVAPADAFRDPARYVIEVETTERSHFPLRRYALEVR